MKKILLAAVALCCIAMAAMMTACTTDSVDNPTPQGQTIHLKMKVSTGDDAATTRSVFHPATGMMEFSDGDEIYLASSGRYIGKLTMQNDVFEGDVLEPTVGEFLHVFFLGNRNIGNLYPGDTECVVKINDQTDGISFQAYGMSIIPYTTPDESYTCVLLHQCALVKVELYNPTDEVVTLHGMKTTALVDFSDPAAPITPRKATGNIKMNAYDRSVKYAVVLPQDAIPEAKMTIGDKEYTIEMPAIEAGNIYQIFKYKIIKPDDEPGYGEILITNGTKTNDNESFEKLFDERLDTKWCVPQKGKKNGVWFVEFNSLYPFIPTGYTLYTGNDNESCKNRNPKSWKLMAKANKEDEWTVISTVTDDQTMEDKNYKGYDFALDVTGQVWQFFRFEVSDNHGDNCMQLSEIVMKIDDGEPEFTGPGKVTVLGYTEGSCLRETTPNNIFDGDRYTYWVCSGYNLITGATNAYVEFCYENGFVPTSYTITNYNGSSLYHWRLKGKENEAAPWILLDYKYNQTDVRKSKDGVFTFDVTPPLKKCRFYRLEIETERFTVRIAEFKVNY